MRKTKEQKGITLIALIITIIVLLILAVVAIGAVQNDGIIDHAKNAREQYGAAQDNENTTLQGYLDKLNENAGNGASRDDLGEDNSENDSVDGSGDNGDDGSGEDNLVEVFTTISASNYGDTITYSEGNVTAWKVFYKDDTHLYIIASNYLNNANLPTGLKMSTNNTTYGAYWESIDDYTSTGASTITSAVAEKYKLSWLEDNSSSESYLAKAVGDLLNVDAWTEKFGNKDKGIEAIGTPTLEMWVASWNASGYTPLYTKYDSTGYYIGTEENPTSKQADLTSDTSGYGDTLYFPHKENIAGCVRILVSFAVYLRKFECCVWRPATWPTNMMTMKDFCSQYVLLFQFQPALLQQMQMEL